MSRGLGRGRVLPRPAGARSIASPCRCPPSVDREVVGALSSGRSAPCRSASARRSAASTRRSGTAPASSTSGPSVSCSSTRYWIACFDARTPPATLTPTARPVWPWKSRAASIMHSAFGRVALTPILPVDVLMKSAPAAMASTDARRIASYEPSSPVSRITLRCAAPAASFDATISSNACGYRPARKAERFSTMSISSAPAATTSRISASRASSGPEAAGNEPATLATCTPVPRSCSTRDRHQVRVEADRGHRRDRRVERVRAGPPSRTSRRPCRACRRPPASSDRCSGSPGRAPRASTPS